MIHVVFVLQKAGWTVRSTWQAAADAQVVKHIQVATARQGQKNVVEMAAHPLGLQSGIAEADLVLWVPQLTPVAPHLRVDGIVRPLDLGALSHQSPVAVRVPSERMDPGPNASPAACISSFGLRAA